MVIAKVHYVLVKILVTPFYYLKIRPAIFIGVIIKEFLNIIFSCDIDPFVKIPFSTKFPHYYGITIGKCKIGKNCIIRQNSTLGRKNYSSKDYPEIGKNVELGSNVCILGDIKIGDYSTIGAGSVVTRDVEPHSIYAGVPAKKIKQK